MTRTTILHRIANDPSIDEGAKRGAAMLVQSVDSRAMQLENSERVIGDNDVLARRDEMQKLADLNARFFAFWKDFADDAAAFAQRHGADVDWLDCAKDNYTGFAEHLQTMIRLGFAKRYVP